MVSHPETGSDSPIGSDWYRGHDMEYECKYIMIERLCLALVWATRRLRHYVTEYSILLVSRLDPLRYLFDRPVLTGRLMRWLVLLTEFDIQYMT